MLEEGDEWSFTSLGDIAPLKRSSRFNLLLLEHGEFYFQDYGVNFFSQKGCIRGRLKLCSRGLLFVPSDASLPCVKYPFYSMDEPISVSPEKKAGHKGEHIFSFRSTKIIQMKEKGRIGPYTYRHAEDELDGDFCEISVGSSNGHGNPFRPKSWVFTFELLHTTLEDFLVEAQALREILRSSCINGFVYESEVLTELIDCRINGVLSKKFGTLNLVDFRESLALDRPVQVNKISPLLCNPGCLMVTDKRIYFQPAEVNNVIDKIISLDLSMLKQIFKRRHMLRQTALEIFMENKTSGYFNFKTQEERDSVYLLIMQQPGVGNRLRKSVDILGTMRQWQQGKIDNFQYLAFLNMAADRSVNDLTQYPVYPWVISDYTRSELDLSDPSVFRDLSKPIGALNPDRLEYFRQRFKNMPVAEEGLPPPFLYGTHYSTPGYVLFYLVRSAPEYMLCLQNGRFDSADRMFFSMDSTWESVYSNHADLKELIPEFYSGSGSFLVNSNDLPLGITQTGQRLNHVELPPWAKSSKDFIEKHRSALESDFVSQRIHHWIDLIFGYKQQGKEAVDADNLFYYLTYEGSIDLGAVDDPKERVALESQIKEFGQCPTQLFTSPHPARFDKLKQVDVAPERYSTDFSTIDGNYTGRKDERSSVAWSDSSQDIVQLKLEELGFEEMSIYVKPHKEALEPNEEHSRNLIDQNNGLLSSFRLNHLQTFNVHRENITGIAMKRVISQDESEVLTICTSSKDSNLILTTVSQCSNEISEKNQIRGSCKRKFSCSDLALGCCALSNDAKFVLAGSWDSSIVMYAVESACQLSRNHGAHDDGISCMALCEPIKSTKKQNSNVLLVTGAWDATVKVWSVEENSKLPSEPLIDFFDLDTPIHSVAIDITGELIAGGAEDGKTVVWDINSGAHLFSYQAPDGKQVCSLSWVHLLDGIYIVIITTGGSVSIHSQFGDQKNYMDLLVDVQCAVCHENIIIVACKDDSIRVYACKSLPTIDFEEICNNADGTIGKELVGGNMTCMALVPSLSETKSVIDGYLLACGMDNGSVMLYSFKTE